MIDRREALARLSAGILWLPLQQGKAAKSAVGKDWKIDKPILFNTPEADRILESLQILPPDSAWHLDVSKWPLHPDSKKMVASVGEEKPLRYAADMNYVIVTPDQKKIPIKLTNYAEESDPGPFPIPDNMPIEGFPAMFTGDSPYKGRPLDELQRDDKNTGGDRHAIIIDPANGRFHEFYEAKKTKAGWTAKQASTFMLNTNKRRPRGWTSADAAGLPIFPAVVRYDELKRGKIDHALRVTVAKSRKAFVSPASHAAGHSDDPSLPRMGERFRLKSSFDTEGFTPEVETILKALKQYGMIVADNGLEWMFAVAPDERIPPLHDELRSVQGSDFEVVEAPRA